MNTAPSRDPIAELQRHRLPAPSVELRDRVLGAAREAWATEAAGPDGLSWFSAVGRLVASAAAALVIVAGASHLNGASLLRWQPAAPRLPSVMAGLPADTERVAPAWGLLAGMAETGSSAIPLVRYNRAVRAAFQALEGDAFSETPRPSGLPQGRNRPAGITRLLC